MKKNIIAIIIVAMFCQLCVCAKTTETVDAETALLDETESVSKENKFALTFEEGGTITWITRIKKQENRSNFVFNDFLVGAYLNLAAKNLIPIIDLTARVALYYPLSYKFNNHPQLIAKPLSFAGDLIVAPTFTFDIADYVYFNLSPGIHYLFQMSDRFYYMSLGGAAHLGVRAPIAKRWSLFLNGIASFDNGNLGMNRTAEPYDFVYQYQVSFGVSYSKKAPNNRYYFGKKI